VTVAPADAGGLEPGFAIGEYRVEGPLGKGGMGTVYAASQPEIGARVAIKVLAADLSRDPRLVRRFVDEARAVNQIRHPNIIDIFAFGRLADGRHYFVMEHLEGETLAVRLARGPLPVSDARRLLGQICEALAAAHAERIVHRDLKPENIWIASPKHGQPYAKILDFGIAKLIESRESPGATEAGVTLGTPYFMSPEQCRGEAVDHRSDIYAMGVLLYFMWSGRLPFEGTTFIAVITQQVTATPPPPSIHRAVPPRLERLILRCLEKDPALRPQSTYVLREELDAALAEILPGETLPPAARIEPPSAFTRETGPGVVAPASAAPARSRRLAVAGVAAVAIAAALVAIVATRPALRDHASAARPVASTAHAPPTSAPVLPAPPVVEPAPAPAGAPAHAAATPLHGEASAPAKPAPAHKPASSPQRRSQPAPSAAEDRGFLRENPFR
jgi:serine/threonine-protein kinase